MLKKNLCRDVVDGDAPCAPCVVHVSIGQFFFWFRRRIVRSLCAIWLVAGLCYSVFLAFTGHAGPELPLRYGGYAASARLISGFTALSGREALQNRLEMLCNLRQGCRNISLDQSFCCLLAGLAGTIRYLDRRRDLLLLVPIPRPFSASYLVFLVVIPAFHSLFASVSDLSEQDINFPLAMFGQTLLAAATLAGSAAAGTVLWDGRFNEFNSSEDLNNWSWANQVSYPTRNAHTIAQSFSTAPFTD